MSVRHLDPEQVPKAWRTASRSPYALFVVKDEVRLALPYVDVGPRFTDSHQEHVRCPV